MSKKRREEWSFFLNRNHITYNPVCRGCTQDCKQSFRMGIVVCDRYWSKRWKPQEDRR